MHRLYPGRHTLRVLAFFLNRVYVRYVGYSPYRIIALFRVCIFCGILFFLYLHFLISPEKIYGYLFKHRFALGAILFAVCVALKLHGSSIGVWNEYVACAPHGSPFQFPILGVPRSIRSDEWDVFTPLAMSQHYTSYAVVNDIACAWPTNMLTTYNQPVWDLTVIAKPFYWGYLLLGSEYGLSWYLTNGTTSAAIFTPKKSRAFRYIGTAPIFFMQTAKLSGSMSIGSRNLTATPIPPWQITAANCILCPLTCTPSIRCGV